MASEYQKGDIAYFTDYDEATKGQKDFEAILEAGQRVRVESVSDAGMIVVAIDEDGATLTTMGTDKDGKEVEVAVADTVFPEELTENAPGSDEANEAAEGEAATDAAPEAAEAAAEPVAEKPKRAAGNGKPKAEPKEKAPTAAQVKAKEKADAKEAAEKAKADAAAKKLADKAAAEKAKADAKAAKEAEKQAKGAAKVAKPDNDDPLMIRVDETQSVSEALKGRSALEAAKMLVDRAEQTDFTLGGVLHNIYVTGEFKSLGFDGKRGFADYADHNLGIGYRKARYLIAIYTTFAQVFRAKGITEDDLLKLGWSKAKELARVPVDQLVKDYDKLMAMASDKEKSRDELTSFIKENYEVTQREEGVKAINLGFRLVADAAEVVNEALNKAKGLAGDGADLNKALEYMAGDWLNTAESQNTMTLQSLIDLAWAQFGVTLAPSEDASASEAGEAAEQAA